MKIKISFFVPQVQYIRIVEENKQQLLYVKDAKSFHFYKTFVYRHGDNAFTACIEVNNLKEHNSVLAALRAINAKVF